MRRRHRSHQETPNHERWLVSYADFITLLFAFFVVMYAVSVVDREKVVQVEDSVRWAMNMVGDTGLDEMPLYSGKMAGGAGVVDQGEGAGKWLHPPTPKSKLEKVRQRVRQRLAAYLQEQPEEKKVVSVKVEGRRVTFTLSSKSFFKSGGAVLRPDLIPILDTVVEELIVLARPIRVEGHTDNSPAGGTGPYRDNWALSSARAASVVTYLENAYQFPPGSLSVGAFGASRPITSNATAQGRDRNRRIDLVVEMEPAVSLP